MWIYSALHSWPQQRSLCPLPPPPPHPVTEHDANNAHGSFSLSAKRMERRGGDLAQVQTNEAYTVGTRVHGGKELLSTKDGLFSLSTEQGLVINKLDLEGSLH